MDNLDNLEKKVAVLALLRNAKISDSYESLIDVKFEGSKVIYDFSKLPKEIQAQLQDFLSQSK